MDNGIGETLRKKLDTNALRRMTDVGEWVPSGCPMIEDIIAAYVTKAPRWRLYLAAAGLVKRRVICIGTGSAIKLKHRGKRVD